MPLLGHAFVGISTYFILPPRLRDPANLNTRRNQIVAFLLPITLLIAFLPDIGSQILLAAGYANGQLLGHSIWFALGAAAVLSVLLKRAGLPTATTITIASIGPISHVLLDALQSTDRHPWWPLSGQAILTNDPPLLGGIAGDIIVIMVCSIVVGTAVLHRLRPGGLIPGPSTAPRLHWEAWSISLVIILAAAGVSVLRDVREKQFWEARLLVLDGQIEKGLALLESSDRWPFVSPPGRGDYLQGLAFLRQGKRKLAEMHLLRSYRENPGYIWVVIDLALFYAGDDGPLETRRKQAAPFLKALALQFPKMKDALQTREQVEPFLLEPGTPTTIRHNEGRDVPVSCGN